MTKLEAIKLSIKMQYQRTWRDNEIVALRNVCEENKIPADFGLIFDTFYGKIAEDSADSELDKIADALILID